MSLSAAFAVFRRYPSPWLLFAAFVCSVAARGAVGGVHVSDGVLVLAILVSFPVVEWLIHVCILHWRPRRILGRTIDSLLARKHREHHGDPRDVPLIFIPWQVFIWLLPLEVLIAVGVFPKLYLGLTYLVVVTAIGLGYEWTHFLIHSDYRPRSSAYKAIWRNHRLHHYKNEHYWFNVTTTGTADRVLGTYPDSAEVETSKTAKNLHAVV